MIRRGTTPTIKRTYPEDLTGATATFCFWQDVENPLTLTPEIEATENGCILSATLTQEQTLSFEPGALYFQIRAVKGDEAVASKVWRYFVADVKPDGEIAEALSVTPGAITPDPDATIDDPYENI